MLLLINLFLTYILPTKVYINIEKVNPIITHTGITFKNIDEIIRYDFRAFNNNDNYITTPESRKNSTLMFPNLDYKILEYKKFNEFRENELIYSKEIYLGDTNYTLSEIIEYEKTINKKYILCINDCRHYVNTLTKWSINREIPIWNLEKLI